MISIFIIFLCCIEASFAQCSNRAQDYIQESCFTSQMNSETNQEANKISSYSENSSNFNGANSHQHRILTTSSAQNSKIYGLSITKIIQNGILSIKVVAKDSSGIEATAGGETFIVKISNTCTIYNQYYCAPNGARTPLSSNVNDIMTDNNDGTYTYSYKVPNSLGIISVQVYLLKPGKVYQEYYSSKDSFLSTSNTNCISSYLNFYSAYSQNICGTSTVDFKLKIITSLQVPSSGINNFNLNSDDGASLYIDDIEVTNNLCSNGIFSIPFSQNLYQNKYYTLYAEYCQNQGSASFILSYVNSNKILTEINVSNIFLPILVDSSPYNIEIDGSICGDWIKTGIEGCDDGNTKNGDGCSLTCTVESGWQCGVSYSSNNYCSEICGDGVRFNSRASYCDDANILGGDGCNSACLVENGWSCTGGTSSSKNTCSEICGDGIRFHSDSTYCDDGNTKNGDGCSSTCSIETGWTCSGGSSTSKDTCKEICGDGIRYNSNSSYCDDGNNVSGDGCDSACYTEVGWTCTGGSLTNKDTCSEICGDGIRFHSSSTYCDDGNTKNGDGCSSTCSIETGWTCSGGSSTSKDTCKEICGDGIRYNSNSSYCDDGNTNNGDGCTSSCSIESGWICKGGSNSSVDICNEICGDGIRFNTNSSYCDDGNTNDDDGCSSSCSIESNWKCSGGNSTHVDKCVETLDQSISEMGQAVAGAAGGVAVVFSLCNISTPTGLWITMNQFQLIMLLLLTNSSIPLSIVAYLSGLKTTTCSFNFLPFKNIPIISKAVHYFDFSLSNEELSYFGINSGSSFVNNF